MQKSSRNIIILGVAATVITVVLTSVSMLIYHNSGDIYLDRSRPGYLPDEEEIEDREKTIHNNYEFSDSGTITDATIDEFLKNFDETVEELEKFNDPFAPQSLSNEILNIPNE